MIALHELKECLSITTINDISAGPFAHKERLASNIVL
jgi:hypothetical protein